jgi:hypothetical protein
MSAKALLSASVSAPPAVYVEDVFSTYLYTGNSSTQTITNGIDLAGEGGLVWVKVRNQSYPGGLYDTERGVLKNLRPDNTDETSTRSGSITAFNSNGFSIGNDAFQTNGTGNTYASWTFRKAEKFFDVVTYTGTGSNRTIAHNLGSVPGTIITKRVDASSVWGVYHRSLGATQKITLNETTAAETFATYWNNTEPTGTEFTVGTNSSVNASGGTYVAYLFAHDAGGFGDAGADNVISCGSYTGNGSAAGPQIDLGWEPQWVLIKKSSDTENWYIYDSMRGVITGPHENGLDRKLVANSSSGESGLNYYDPINFGASGFNIGTTDNELNGSGGTYIYIAIRRGPMRAPESGTEVFAVDNGDGSSVPSFTSGFPVDFGMSRDVGVDGFHTSSRLTSGKTLDTNSTAAEGSNSNYRFDYQSGWFGSALSSNYYSWMFRRAPGFFDVVCYTGTGSARTVAHNLAAVPELIIVKARSNSTDWSIYSKSLASAQYLVFRTPAADTNDAIFGFGYPSATTFNVDRTDTSNASGYTYVAYLFATLPGVSKVGSYTGTGTTLSIDCGFTAGARFVLIKRTDSTGDWYVWDTARGIVSGDDPYLLLNSTAAQVTNTDYIDPLSSGFQISSTAPAAINASGGTYIFLAIA